MKTKAKKSSKLKKRTSKSSPWSGGYFGGWR